MESRIQHLSLALLTALLALTAVGAHAAKPEDIELEPLVVPEEERRKVRVNALDKENFELGGFGGVMNVEDFGSNPVYGARFAYHVTEGLFVEGIYAQTELGLTSFEELSGGALLFPEDERDLTYYNVSVGWNIFPGEAFVGKWAFRGSLYVVAGVGSTELGDDSLFTVSGGFGYRLAMTDWLALHADVRNYVYETDLLGEAELKNNVEFSGGLTIFF